MSINKEFFKIASPFYLGFQMAPRATYHCFVDSMLPASYGLSGPVVNHIEVEPVSNGILSSSLQLSNS